MRLRDKLLVGLCVSLLTLSLLSIGTVGGLYKVLGSAGPLKEALRDTGMYQTIIGDALQQAQKDNPGQGDESIPTDKAEVRSVIQAAFPPSFLQTQTERGLDALYAWLQGTTPAIAFSIDLSEPKARLADGMATLVQQRFDSLPTCTAADTPNLPPSDIDAFSASCVPTGFNKTEAANKTRNDILQGDFLKDTTFNIDTIKNDHGETLSQQLREAPDWYQTGKTALYLWGSLAVLASVGIVFLGKNWRSGLRRWGVTLAIVGTTCLLLGLLSSFVMQRASTEFAKTGSGSEPLQQKLIHIATALVNDLRGWLVGYGIALIVLGAAAIIAWFFVRRPVTAEVLAHRMQDDPSQEFGTQKPPAGKPGRAGMKPKLPDIQK